MVSKALVVCKCDDLEMNILHLIINIYELKKSGIIHCSIVSDDERLEDEFNKSEFRNLTNGVMLRFLKEDFKINEAFIYLDNQEICFPTSLFVTRQLINTFIVTRSPVIGLVKEGDIGVDVLLEDGRLSLIKGLQEKKESNLFLTGRCLLTPDIYYSMKEKEDFIQHNVVYGYQLEGNYRKISKNATICYKDELLAYIKKLLKEEKI